MFAPRFRSAMTHGLVALGIFGWVASAEAQPKLDSERAELVRQLAEYRQRIQKLEDRLRQLEARRSAEPRAELHTDVSAKLREVDACTLPFSIDSSGLKHLRPECAVAKSIASCDSPFALDENGIKRVRVQCQVDATSKRDLEP